MRRFVIAFAFAVASGCAGGDLVGADGDTGPQLGEDDGATSTGSITTVAMTQAGDDDGSADGTSTGSVVPGDSSGNPPSDSSNGNDPSTSDTPPGSSDGDSGSSDGVGTSDGGSSDGGSSDGGSSETGDCGEEVCDGEDNDCDFAVDEIGCTCLPGQSQACYDGPPGTAGIGACAEGTQDCDDDGQSWLPCEDQVLPESETCNNEDDDCDTIVDDGLGSETCGEGICQVTVDPSCVGGVAVACVPLQGEPDEICINALDDDCNGLIDDGCACQEGQEYPCYGGPPGTAGVGICAQGTQLCQGGVLQACEGAVTPIAESCNGLDDDCDGTPDDGDPGGGGGCSTGSPGPCDPGVTTCSGGSLQCNPIVTPSSEVCNGSDDDCDGVADDGNPGGGQGCATGLPGVCGSGTTSCSFGGIVCNQNIAPSGEACDGSDNDCDGSSDEGDPGGGQACSTGLPGPCNAGTTSCSGGSLQCNQNQGASGEVCDNVDNDCNGAVDDGNPGGGGGCSTGQPGQCGPGTYFCSGGSVQCFGNQGPSGEGCDNVDNDCNGAVDDGNPGGGQGCSTGLPGVCNAGTTNCIGGGIQCNQNQGPSGEVCDGLDNDCNGAVDEGVCIDGCVGYCGGQSPQGCWCDAACVSAGDCCYNACSVCGQCGGGGGCVGYCGGQSIEGCWCDLSCVAIGDCCFNACSECGAC